MWYIVSCSVVCVEGSVWWEVALDQLDEATPTKVRKNQGFGSGIFSYPDPDPGFFLGVTNLSEFVNFRAKF